MLKGILGGLFPAAELVTLKEFVFLYSTISAFSGTITEKLKTREVHL
jgi:hypothetical protein